MTITPNLPFDSYQSIKRMNPSTIVAGRVSMLALKDAIDYARQETPAMRFGTGFHVLLLTPEEFDAKYTIEPDWASMPENRTADGRPSTNSGTTFVKTMRAKFRETDSRYPMSHNDYYLCRSMIKSLHSKPEIRQLFESAHDNREVTLEGVIQGVEFKGRVDMLCPTCIPDVKTSRTVDPRRVYYAFDDLSYHHKMAIYQELVRQNSNHRPCKYIVVEKSRPFDCVLINIPDFFLAKKLEEVKDIVRQYKQCLETGVWPGVDGGHGAQEMFIPPSEVDEAVQWDVESREMPEEQESYF